jgi:DUF177 domain-containing protein
MSGSLDAWYGRRELESLAERDDALCGELPLSKLTRLISMLNSDIGSVRASLRFNQRRDGWLGAKLDYEASAELRCQRCLEPFRHDLAGRVSLVLADRESMPATVPEGYEPFELMEGRLSPVRLIEDELIISVPLVPRHARQADCGSLGRDPGELTEGSAAPEAADR